MARTISCSDIGYECAYRLTTDDGQDDFILEATLQHAVIYHPELTDDQIQLKKVLSKKIRNLLDQSGYQNLPKG